MTILITGAAGQLGRSLQKMLSSLDMPVIALTKQDVDITCPQAIDACFAQFHPRYLINTAAYTAVDKAESESEQAFAVNSHAVGFLAQACARYQTKLIHFSTDYVFDGLKETPYVEEDMCHPLSVYGKSKLAGEQAIQHYLEDYLILRVSWLFSEYPTNFVQKIAHLLQVQPRLSIVADQKGCPTSAESIGEVIRLILQDHAYLRGVYHYCDAPFVSWYDFARVIQDCLIQSYGHVAKEIIPIASSQWPTPAHRPKNSVLNCQKIQTALNIKCADWREKLTFLNFNPRETV